MVSKVMIKLKVHTKPVSPQTDIDKYLLVPKKLWDDFGAGETSLKLNGTKIKTRIYEIPCHCVGEDHFHRIVDLRELWEKLDLKENVEVEIEK